MTKDYSFDVVSTVDMNEVRNAVNLAQKEIATRYDFRNSACRVALDAEGLVLNADNDGKLRAVVDLLQEKLVRRKVPLKALQYHKVEAALGGTVRQRVALVKGVDEDRARSMNKALRREFKKLKVSVQGDSLRISSPSKDELQAAMTFLREQDFDIPLQFVNYR